MAVNAKNVVQLLAELAEKATKAVKLDYGVFGKVYEHFDFDISQKYMDDTYRKANRAIDKGVLTIGSRRSKLDELARALRYKSFQDFENKIKAPVDPVLKNCLGKWWSLVRGNTGEVILKAPVWIRVDAREGGYMNLKGQKNEFMGKIAVRAGCLFCELHSDKGKQLYIILKGNINPEAVMLQGIFTGISSTADPIGGRGIFIRETKLSYEDMIWSNISLNDNNLDPLIREYFLDKKENCIKINNMVDLRSIN